MRDLGSDSIAAQPRVVVVPQSSRRLSAQTLWARKAQHNVAGRCKRAFELFLTLSRLSDVQLPKSVGSPNHLQQRTSKVETPVKLLPKRPS